MLRTTLFTALGVSVLAMSAHAQSRVPYSTTYVQVQAQADPEATGAITSESPSATGVVPSGKLFSGKKPASAISRSGCLTNSTRNCLTT